MKRTFTLILVIIVSTLAAFAQLSKDEREIRELIAGSDRAKLKADVVFFERAYADDYSYTSAKGVLDNKSTSLDWYRKNLKENPPFRLFSMKSEVERIKVSGLMAFVSGTWAATILGTEKNPLPPYVNKGRFTSVLEKRNGRWMIVAEHDSEASSDRNAAERKVTEEKSPALTAHARGLEFSSAVVRASASAWSKQHVETLVDIYTEDAILFPPKGEPIRGRNAIRAFWTRTANRRILQHSIKTERADVSGDLLTEHGRFTALFQTGGNAPVSSPANFISVWKREADGIWRKHLDSWW